MMRTDTPTRSVEDRVVALLEGMGEGSFGPCAYTTAWLARYREDFGAHPFRAARRWLLEHQRADGSWGGAVELVHDRTVSTLAAIMALAEGPPSDASASAVEAGLAYLRTHSKGWEAAPTGETMGFEVVVPYLLEEAAALGMDLPYEDWAGLAAVRRDKLSRIPPKRLLTEPTSLMFSLEALVSGPALGALVRFASPDGGLANSPSATAALCRASGDPGVFGYLKVVADLDPAGGVPSIYPTEAFELAWVLHHLQRAGLLAPRIACHRMAQLRRLMRARGHMALSDTFPLPDPDDSAMALIVLHDAGHDVGHLLDGLLAFEGESCFFTYPGERDGSVTPNARVLEALSLRPGAFAAQRRKLLEFLRGTCQEDAWWYDKWHVSPYYATAQVTFALLRAGDWPMRKTARWLLETQRADGSWGWYRQGTPEETAYAVLNLDALARVGAEVPAPVWAKAHDYLTAHLDGPYPELWVGKSLYTPHDVARSAVLAGAAVAAGHRSLD